MRTFKDQSGRERSLSVNISSVKRVKALLGVDLLRIHKGDPPLIMQLGSDPVLQVDVLYALIKPDLDVEGISDEQFGALLGGDGYGSASDAFFADLVDFFHGLRRFDLVSLVEKSRTAIRTMVDVGRETTEAEDVETELRARMLDAITKLKAMYRTSGNSLNTLPELPASTPVP